MHGGSSRNDKKIDKDTNWINLEPCIPPGAILFTLHVPIESDLQPIESL